MNKLNCDEIINEEILFITTKNIDYIRNVQEINMLEKNNNQVKKIFSNKKFYIMRIVEIYFKLFFIKMNKYSVVFIGFSPQLILTFWRKKFKNQYIVIDFFISLYDTFVFDRKKVPNKSKVADLLKRLDIFTLKSASHVITDTKAHANYFKEEFYLEQRKIEVLYLLADKSIYYPREQRKRVDLSGKFVVLYFGSVLPLQGVEIVLESISFFKDKSNIYFQMIGPIGKDMKRPIASNIEYIKWLPQEKLAEYIANADLCLAGHFAGNIEKAKRTIPGKAYIYSMMQKQMVLGDNAANKEIFDSKNGRIKYVKMGNADNLREVIWICENEYRL